MKDKKLLVILSAFILILGGVALGYAWRSNRVNAPGFTRGGYILQANPEVSEKQLIFSQGTKYHMGMEDTIVFEDIRGAKASVSEQSFIHYDDSSLQALKSGVVVDLNDLDNSGMTNHYSINDRLVFVNNSDNRYTVDSTKGQLEFAEFIWKLSQDKYMVVSKDFDIYFSDKDIRGAEGYIEVTYIDEGVLQIQTADNVWQTVSENCYAILSNGEIVNFTYKNIQNADGEVLMDFSKMVLDSEDNIEVTPLTDNLLNIKESVIPHFDITAEQGENGDIGMDGEIGDDGEEGIIGEDGGDGGEGGAGDNGAPGATAVSGTDGDGGNNGDDGEKGKVGLSTEVQGNLLNFPIFTIDNWYVDSTGCSGHISITDKDSMLMNNGTNGINSLFTIYDMTTNEEINTSVPDIDFATSVATGVDFNCDSLKPDHQYRLVCKAPTSTDPTDESKTYSREYVSKIFWTDSAGVTMTADNIKKDSSNIILEKQDYSATTMSTVYLFTSASAAQAFDGQNEADVVDRIEVTFTGTGADKKSAEFTGLESNKIYYVRMSATSDDGTIIPPQMIEFTTTKAQASLGTPVLAANRGAWGFELTPGVVFDKDSAIEDIIYEFYDETQVVSGVLTPNAQVAKTLVYNGSNAITVPIDNYLQKDTNYVVRATARVNDNNKSYYIYSGLSSPAIINAGKLPSVYFVEGKLLDKNGNAIADQATSSGYDKIYGTLVVDPGADGAKLWVSGGKNRPTVTVSTSGLYHASYPVYTAEEKQNNIIPSEIDKYLVAEVNPNGYVYIQFYNKSSLTDEAGSCVGLKDNTSYTVTVTGDITEDGATIVDENIRIGSVVVDTRKIVALKASWQELESEGADERLNLSLKLGKVDNTADYGGNDIYNESYEHQMNMLTRLRLTLKVGTSTNPGETLAVVDLVDKHFEEKPDQMSSNNLKFVEDLSSTLQSSNGLIVNMETFNIVKDTPLYARLTDASQISTVNITIDEVDDYTYLSSYRADQTPINGASPYINQFPVSNKVRDFVLGESPDPVPGEASGLKVTPLDDNGDGYKDDSYILIPNYPNSSKLAKTITYYAFDNPDFIKDYSKDATSYEKVDPFTASHIVQSEAIPLSPVTCKSASEEKTNWLGRITIPVPESGVMPMAKFIPTTAREYFESKYPGETAKINAHIANYETAINNLDGSANAPMEDDYVLFFLDDTRQDEPARGHQFVFAWTMIYQLNNKADRYAYPYTMQNLGTHIPQSGVYDVPRHDPLVYALPWKEEVDDKHTIYTWKIYAHDEDDAIIANDDKKTELFWQKGMSSVASLSKDSSGQTGVYITVNKEALFGSLMDTGVGDEISYIYNESDPASKPISVKTQWYTNRYTTDGKVLGASNDYTEDTKLHCTNKTYTLAGNTKKKNILQYYQVFVSYRDDQIIIPNPNDYILDVDYWRTGENDDGNILGFKCTVTANTGKFDSVNGLRLIFEATDGTKVVLDKYLEGMDNETVVTDDGNGKASIVFYISLSREMARLSGKMLKAFRPVLLYEGESTGYAHINGNNTDTYAIRAYRTNKDSSKGTVELTAPVRYRYNSNGDLVNTNGVFPRMGSFFKGGVSGTGKSLTLKAETTAFAVNREKKLMVNIAGGIGAVSGANSIIPVLLEESTRDLNAGGGGWGIMTSQNLPEVTPVISGKTTVMSNKITFDYSYTNPPDNAYANTYFLLRKLKYSGDSSNYVTVVYDAANETWNESNIEFKNKYTSDEANKILNVHPGGNRAEFNDLDADTNYEIVAYYKLADNTYQRLDMMDARGTYEVANYFDCKTATQPDIRITGLRYSTYRYDQRYIRIDSISISNAYNFYAIIELLDEEGKHLAYLDTQTSSTNSYIIDVGNKEAQVSISGSHVRAYSGVSFDTTNHKMNSTIGDFVHLDYDTSYRIGVRVYNKGKGPLYESNYDMNSDKDRMNTYVYGAPVGDSTYRDNPETRYKFTTPIKQDELSILSVYNINNGIPRVRFTSTYVRNASLLSDCTYVMRVVRSRQNNDGTITYTPVTDRFTFLDGSEALGQTVEASTNKWIYLDQKDVDGEDELQKGDVYTCYFYGVVDLPESTNSKGTYTNITYDDILKGWSLDSRTGSTLQNLDYEYVFQAEAGGDWNKIDVVPGDDANNKNYVQVPEGTGTHRRVARRVKLATSSVTVNHTSTNAGVVTIYYDKDSKVFEVTMDGVYNHEDIQYIDYTITGQIRSSDQEGHYVSESYSSDGDEELFMELSAGSRYLVYLYPQFTEYDISKFDRFNVTLVFKDKDGNPVDAAPGNEESLGMDGCTISSAIVITENAQ